MMELRAPIGLGSNARAGDAGSHWAWKEPAYGTAGSHWAWKEPA